MLLTSLKMEFELTWEIEPREIKKSSTELAGSKNKLSWRKAIANYCKNSINSRGNWILWRYEEFELARVLLKIFGRFMRWKFGVNFIRYLLSQSAFQLIATGNPNANSGISECFSIACRKTKTKVITLTNQHKRKQQSEPIRTRSKYL